MNELDLNPDYKKIYGFNLDVFLNTKHFGYGPFDETFYSMRVYETCKDLIKRTNFEGNKEIILVAALLHDIGKKKLDESKLFNDFGMIKEHKKEWRKHASLSVEIVEDFLKSIGHSEKFINKVCYLIKNHDFREKGQSFELQLLQDADLLADCGIAGFIRPFLYGAKFKRPVMGSIIHFLNSGNRVKDESRLNIPESLELLKEIEKEEDLFKKLIEKMITTDVIDVFEKRMKFFEK